MKVLICEDEEVMLTALEFRLRKHGFEVILAEDGRKALQKIKEEEPDVLVADIMMPYVTGLEVLHHIRHELKSSLPVIIISALDNQDIVLEAFEIGANDFISKPFKPDELVLRIKLIIQEMNLAKANG